MPTWPHLPCEGTLPRRSFLRASLTGLSGLGLADLLRLDAVARSSSATRPEGAPSIILVWLWGGPSHMDTFDLKPEAPDEYRGQFRPIPTCVPGMEICEHLPLLARNADKFALIRSVSHDSPGHINSTHTVLTGFDGELVETPPYEPKSPDILNAAHALLPSRLPGMPQWVALPRMRYEGGAYLGPSHGPYAVSADPSKDGFKVPELDLDDARRGRLAGRGRLLEDFDRLRRSLDATEGMDALDSYQRQALSLLTGTAARDAFDIGREHPKVRDRYGRDEIGQRCLLARRLVESGVRLVSVDFPCVPGQKAFSWDDHASVWNIFEQMQIRLPVLDRAVSALIEDVHARGMDRETLIVVMGEMSHTPKLSNFRGQPGREHWGKSMSILLSGGGMPNGQVIGATDRRGEEPSDRPFHPSDVLATWYRYLGLDPHALRPDLTGRPVPLLPRGEPIRELI